MRTRACAGWLSGIVAMIVVLEMMAEEIPIPPDGIDHLLYASADLERGMDEIEALFGVRPVRGGHHPQYGTHNALLSLGPGMYLEVIARDPDLPEPEGGALVDIPATENSRLITWVFRSEDIEHAAARGAEAGIGLGPVTSGSRTKPDGSEITWQLTDPYAMPLDGAVPFLINWGSTAHPSTVVPEAGRLVKLVIEHPESDRVRNAISALGADVKIVQAERFAVVATIETRDGLVTLR